jgi:hypothetical protein
MQQELVGRHCGCCLVFIGREESRETTLLFCSGMARRFIFEKEGFFEAWRLPVVYISYFIFDKHNSEQVLLSLAIK